MKAGGIAFFCSRPVELITCVNDTWFVRCNVKKVIITPKDRCL